MPAPTNTTPATATAISSLPYSQVLDVTGAPQSLTNIPDGLTNAYNAVWYKYTVPAGVYFIYVGCNRDVTSDVGFDPATSIWTGTVGSLTNLVIGSNTYTSYLNGGTYFRLPVTPGNTYWIQVCSDTAGPNPSVISFSVALPNRLAAPAGSIVICDDADDYPALILDTATGAFLNTKPYPAGEYTDSQPDGTYCAQNGTNDDSIAFLDSEFNVLTTVSVAPSFISAIKSDRNGNFYVITRSGGTKSVKKFTSAGVLVYTKALPADFNSLYVCAVDRTGTRLYAASSTANTNIHVYNLSTDTQEADLAVAVAGESFIGGGDGYITASGDLVFMKQVVATSIPKVVRYNTSGVLQQTYNPTTLNYGQHFCFCDDSPGSFVIWGYVSPETNNNAVFERIGLDGTSLSNVTGIPVTSGSMVSREANNANAISNSCPVFVLTVAIAAVVTAPSMSGLYKIVPDKRSDTLYIDVNTEDIGLFKIPDPYFITGLIGDEP